MDASPIATLDRRATFKEKFVSLFEDIFALQGPVNQQRDKGITGKHSLQRFWDELLLLKVNEVFLADCISREPEPRLTGPLKAALNDIFAVCARYLLDANFIRVAHALEIMAVLLRELFKKRFSEQGFTIITMVAGSSDLADSFFKRLLADVAHLHTKRDSPLAVRALSLRLFLVIVTGRDNISSNSIAAYFFLHPLFDALVAALSSKVPQDQRLLEVDASLVLTHLCLWHEASNPYIDRLSQPTAPLLPLLHSVHSLFLPGSPTHQPGMSRLTAASAATAATVSTASTDTTGVSSMFFFASSWFASPPDTPPAQGPANEAGPAGISPATGHRLTQVDVRDRQRCRSSAGVLLLYFLVYLNPVMRSPQVWRKPEDLARLTASSAPASTTQQHQRTGSPATVAAATPPASLPAGHSLSLLWMTVFRAFLSLCWRAFRALPSVLESANQVAALVGGLKPTVMAAGSARSSAAVQQVVAAQAVQAVAASAAGASSAIHRAKVCLMLLRLLVEEPSVVGFLAQCDAGLLPMSPGMPAVSALPPSTANGKVLSLVLQLATDILSMTPPGGPHTDADLYLKAAAVVASILAQAPSHFVTQPIPYSEATASTPASATAPVVGMDWQSVWAALAKVCDWCSDTYLFLKPGVPDLASQAIAILEYALACGADALGSVEEVEALHAAVLFSTHVFSKLAATAASLGVADKYKQRGRRASFTGDFKMLNLTAVRTHYEVQLAAMGVRGFPTEQQALECIHKKGLAGLKFKTRPAIAAHSYIEGTNEVRVLNGLARALTAEHRRLFMPNTPKVDLELEGP